MAPAVPRRPERRSLPGVAYPLQARGWETFERVLDSTEALLVDVDFDALRIEDVLQEAKVSNGSFYARFESKEALLAALLDRYRLEVERTLDALDRAVGPEATLEERAQAYVRVTLRRFRKRRGLLRTLSLHYRLQPKRQSEPVDVAKTVNERVVAFFAPVKKAVRHRRKDEAIVRGTYFVSAVLRDRALFENAPHASTVPLSNAALGKELTRLLISYLSG